MQTATFWDAVADNLDPSNKITGAAWKTPGDIAKTTNPKTVQTPALDLIDEALVEAMNTPDARLIISMAPQEGKSVRVANDFPVWCLTQNPELRIVTASYGQGLANRNGRAVRNRIAEHPELGLTVARDNGSVSEWTLAGHQGGLLSVGIGAGVTGRPADLIIIDDPVKDAKDADSETVRQNTWDWWTSTASTRLAPGASVVMILTRWHEDDLAGKMMGAEDGAVWKFINIPAMADHNPDKGETDPLGRQPGEYLVSTRGRTVTQWEAIRKRVGSRVWNALYQGRPSASEGNMFMRGDWQWYEKPLWTQNEDGSCTIPLGSGRMLMSWDMAFKDTKNSDYVVGQVWLHRGPNAYLLDQVRGRMNFTDSKKAVRRLIKKWPQCSVKLVEDKANGTAIIDVLKAEYPGFIPVTPHESKEARASAVTPFVESSNVYLPDESFAPWINGLVDEAASFPNAAHDDQVDCMTQALNRIFIRGGRATGWLDFFRSQGGGATAKVE
jgi:predicted phage terminase large subunit-like protein